jgi:hypothetical protein
VCVCVCLCVCVCAWSWVEWYTGLSTAWNASRFGLRHGDRAKVLPAGANSQRGQKRRKVHSNKWFLENAINLSFDIVGKVAPSRVGDVGNTRRRSDISSGSAGLHKLALAKPCKALLQSGFLLGLVIARNYDCTPLQVFYGLLAGLVMDFGRYLWQSPDTGKWELKSLAEFRQLKGANFKPKYGVLEIMASLDSLWWKNSSGQSCHEEILNAPCVLAQANASTLYNALELVSPNLDRQSIHELSERVECFLMYECPDAVRSNGRTIKYTRIVLPDNCMHVGGKCSGHVGHLIVEDAIDEKALIGDVYALQFICHLASHFNTLVATAREFIFRHGERIPGAPPPEFATHTKAILKHTLRYYNDLIRARLDYGANISNPSEGVKPGKSEGSLSAAEEQVLAKFNGDITRKTPEYYLDGRVVDDGIVADEQIAAALNAGFFQGEKDTMPHCNRWGSCMESTARIGGGVMVQLNNSKCAIYIYIYIFK